jgi:hypothetical protein
MNKLATTDLDKLDQLNQDFIDAIKAQKLAADLEIFMRAEFAGFIGRSIEKYNVNAQPGATY